MGTYVYQVTKGQKALIDTDCFDEIGVLKYYTKPYFHIWNDVLSGWSAGYTDRIEKKIAKGYRLFLARQKRVIYRRYVVYKFEDGQDVYEMPVNSTWTYDCPTIGKGEVGKLVYNGTEGYWSVEFTKRETNGREKEENRGNTAKSSECSVLG